MAATPPGLQPPTPPPPPLMPGGATAAPAVADGPRPQVPVPVGAGQAALLLLAGVTLVEGVGVAVSSGGSDPQLAGGLGLLIGGVLYALAMIGRLLRRAAEIRSLLAVVGALLAAGGAAALSDGLAAPGRVALAAVVILVLATAAAQRLPSALAAALAALALVAGPGLVIGSAGGGVVGFAVAGAVALALVVVAGSGDWQRRLHLRLGFSHPAAASWVLGSSALAGAAIVALLAEADGGVATWAVVVAAIGLTTAAQRAHSVVLGFAAFFALAATVAEAVTLSGGSIRSVAAELIVAGLLLAATAVLAGAMSRGSLAVSGGPAIGLRFEEVLITLAAVLTLAAATGAPAGSFGGRNPFTPTTFGGASGSSSGSGSFTFQPGPTDGSGLPCPSLPPSVPPPAGCP